MNCGTTTCSVGCLAITSVTIGWPASASADGWISAGFAVEQSVETDQQWNCNGERGEYIAVWKKVGQTAYTVQNNNFNQYSGPCPRGNPYAM